MKRYKWLLDNQEIADTSILASPLWNDCNRIITSALGELNMKEKLKELYVPNSSFNLHRLPAFILGIQYSDYIKFSKNDDYSIIPDVNNFPETRLTCLYGEAGIGKSTFLKYTFDVEIEEAKKKLTDNNINYIDIVPVFLNFKHAPVNESEIENWVINTISKEFKSLDYLNTKDVFVKIVEEDLLKYRELDIDSEIINKRKEELLISLIENNEYYIKSLAWYIRKINQKLVLIFDNLDHHYDESYISRAIRIGQWFTHDYTSTTIIALRNYNMGMLLKNLTHDLAPYNVTFDPPNLEYMFNKRLDFIKREIKKLNTLTYTIDDVALLGQGEVFEMLKSASGNNHRIILEVVRHIFKSGYLFDKKINKVRFNYIRVLRALLYENFKVFKPNNKRADSILFNIFENEDPSYIGNWLIRLRLLQLLENKKTTVDEQIVIEEMAIFGYHETKTIELINNFSSLSEKLIERYTGKSIEGRQVNKVQISELGRLHLRLVNQIEYIDAMRSATYLPNDVYEAVNKSKLYPKEFNSVNQRIEEIYGYINFLLEKESIEFQSIKNNNNIFNALELHKSLFTIKNYFFNKWDASLKRIREISEEE